MLLVGTEHLFRKDYAWLSIMLCDTKTNWLWQFTRGLMDRMLQYPAFFMRPSLGICVLSVPVNRPLPPLLSDSKQVLYPSLWSLSLVVTHFDRVPGWLNCHITSVSPVNTRKPGMRNVQWVTWKHVLHSHYYFHWHKVPQESIRWSLLSLFLCNTVCTLMVLSW